MNINKIKENQFFATTKNSYLIINSSMGTTNMCEFIKKYGLDQRNVNNEV